MKAAAAVLAGAALLAWPALVNGYPLVFSDTAGLLEMGLRPEMGWDKPWVYGPLTVLLHWSRSLWGVAAGQAAMLSAVLWAVGRMSGGGAGAHVLLCAALAIGSAAPWFTTFAMPDVFAPVTVLCLALLAFGGLGRPAAVAVTALAAVAAASHLTHLLIAAACLPGVLLLRPRRVPACLLPLLLALGWLMGSNAVGNGVLGVSPYGAVFALARLQADGPGAAYIKGVCPQAALRVCRWADQLPMNSDAFLWSPDGPVWKDEFGPILFAPEASRLVPAILRAEPLAVVGHAARNTLRQLVRVRLGDTLGPQYLVDTVGLLLRTYFPPAELARFAAGRQVAGTLGAVASRLAGVQDVLLALGAGVTLLLPFLWRRDPALAGLALLCLGGVLANAFATGALSGPHDRYGARIAWLLLLPPMLWAQNAWRRWRVEVAR